jgi:hypothetical protein
VFHVVSSGRLGTSRKYAEGFSRHSGENILDSPPNIVGILLKRIMRSLAVVATTSGRAVNRFAQASLTEARNLKDFLEQTGEYASVAIFELEKSIGPLRQWAELEESSR